MRISSSGDNSSAAIPASRPAHLSPRAAGLGRPILLATVFTVQLGLSGCFLLSAFDTPSTSESKQEESEDDDAKEVKPSDAPVGDDAPEAELIRSSKRLYQSGMYSVAQGSLTSLRDRYPLGAYGSWAAIKAGDAYYYNGEFDKAAKFFEEFLKNYPGSPDTPYVKLQAARAHLASASGTGRDRQPLERSLELFDDLEQNYPRTPYAVMARSERTPALNDLTAYDMFIINFYRKKGNLQAVAAREKLFQERWGKRMKDGEFKETSEEIPLEALQQPELEREGEAAEPKAVRADQSFETPQEILSPEMVVLKRVDCNTKAIPFAMIEVSTFPEEYASGLVIEELHPEDGHITIPDLSAHSTQRAFNCFTEGDISVADSGALSLKTDHSYVLTTLQSPPRILLTRVEKGVEAQPEQ